MSQLVGHEIVDLVVLDDNSDFPARLNGIGLSYAVERPGEGFQMLKPLRVPLDRFAAGSRPGSADCISRLDDRRNRMLHRNILMM